MRGDKRGAIPAHLAPILDRAPSIDLDAWLALMRSSGHFGLGSFGALASRAREALRRGARWIIEDRQGQVPGRVLTGLFRVAHCAEHTADSVGRLAA